MCVFEGLKQCLTVEHMLFIHFLKNFCIILHIFLSIMLSVQTTIYKDVVDIVKENNLSPLRTHTHTHTHTQCAQ